ncbi:MAG: PIN domain-containing protein [Planctomycetaceae bacterium]|jgi:predicted nucleic acid-binding protein|nr:PIN domain-containing protein [Planctomycetaceae bacterium]
MTKITIDINILLDFLFKREGHENVVRIFKYCSDNKIKGFICAHEITTLSYFLSKTIKEKDKIVKALCGIMKRFNIIEINEKILNEALYSELNDFEDAVIEISSKEKKIEYIITRNIKDFRKSQIKAVVPEEFLIIIQHL